MTRLMQFANNATSRLAATLSAVGTTVTVIPGDGAKFPSLTAGQYFMATLIKADGSKEVVKVTARASDTLTIVRAAEAVGGVQTAYSFNAADRIDLRLTAGELASEFDRLDRHALTGVLNKSANYTAVEADASNLIRVDSTTAACTITLPQISTLTEDFIIAVSKVSGDNNAVYIAGSGGNTINGATPYALVSQWQGAWLVADRSTNTWTAVSSGIGSSFIFVDKFTGTGAQTAFTLTAGVYSSNQVDVTISGVTQNPGIDYTATGTTLTFTSAPPNATVILARYTQSAPQVTTGTCTTERQVATLGQTGFALANGYIPGSNTMQVFVNGLLLSLGIDYTEAGTNAVAFTSGLSAGDEVQFVVYGKTVSAADSGNVGYTPAGTGAVATTVQTELNRQTVSIFRYLTDAQISAIQAYIFTADLTSIINSALADIRSRKCDVYFPAGGYLGNFIVPGTVDGLGTDDRNTAFRIYGQGTGEPFVQLNTGGTVFKGVASIEQPVLTDILGTASSSNGTVEIDHIRFDGNTSTVPVVRLQSFYGLSSFHHNVVYQRGVGDGVVLGWGATVSVYANYVMNKDWATFGLGATRVGTGISYIPTADNGLVTISKCTSRGWLTAYQIAGDAAAYSACIEKSECSVVYNGVLLQSNADKCVVSGCYFEGGEGGVGINNLGSYNTIKDNLFFPGFATCIQDIGTSNRGSLIEGNLVSIGGTVSGKGIAVVSSAVFGGYNKNVLNNFVTYTAGTTGVSGIDVSGTDPRLNVNGNMFDPRSAWTGASTLKINDTSTNGVYGLIQQELGDMEIPVLSHGAVAFQEGVSALTQANVSSNTLTIPSVGSYFSCNATSACTVQILSAGVTPGRVVVLRTDSANMTFQETAYIQLAGGASFSGPGMLTLMVDRIGASNYAYEISRTVF